MKKSLLGIILGLSIALTACGSAATADYAVEAPAAVSYKGEMAEEAVSFDSDASFGEAANGSASTENVTTTENATTSNRKLIKTVDLTVETKQFDSLVDSISNQIVSIGGYVESMNGYYGSQYSSYRSEKNATIVARIPATKLDEFIASVGANSNITYRSENVTDVTLDYVDLESHKKMLKEEQDRLMDFLEQAETIEDIIAIEDRLTNVKYQLDSMESQIRTYDNKVDYSTVTLNINEVIDYTVTVEPEKNAFERMAEGFVNSLTSIGVGLKEFGIWFVIKIPYFILWGIIIAIVVVVTKKIRSKNPEKAAARQAKKAAKKEARNLKKNKGKVTATETAIKPDEGNE